MAPLFLCAGIKRHIPAILQAQHPQAVRPAPGAHARLADVPAPLQWRSVVVVLDCDMAIHNDPNEYNAISPPRNGDGLGFFPKVGAPISSCPFPLPPLPHQPALTTQKGLLVHTCALSPWLALTHTCLHPHLPPLTLTHSLTHTPSPQILRVLEDSRYDLVLTPQFFTNVQPYADVFNHLNPQFWWVLGSGCAAPGAHIGSLDSSMAPGGTPCWCL